MNIDILNPNQDADFIVQKLLSFLPSWASVFDFGAWKWRQAIFLAKNGVQVYVQDREKDYLEVIEAICIQENLSNIFIEEVSEAQNYKLKTNYDALLCIRVLHFLGTEDAKKVIENMKEHTKKGWHNVLQVFLKETEHKPEYFFPDLSELETLYNWWQMVTKTEVKNSESSNTTNGRIMYQMGIIFRKL